MSPEEYMLPCLNKKLFGFECMGCGLQRSVALILKGEFIEAFYMYPAIYALIALFSYITLNLFFKFENSNRITTILGVLSLLIIIINFTYKLLT